MSEFDRKRLMILGLALVCVWTTTAGAEFATVRSSLDRPDRSSPPLLTIGPSLGGAPDWQLFRYGVGGSVLFRPDAASEIFTPLYDWNTALVLQWEYRDVDRGASLLAADAMLRRYIGDDSAPGASKLFAGIGGGVARVTFPPPTSAAADTSGGGTDDTDTSATVAETEDKYLSFVVEVGYERALSASAVLLWKLQWRSYVWGGRDFSNYTAHVRIGFPLPW